MPKFGLTWSGDAKAATDRGDRETPAMNESARARIQVFRDKATEHSRRQASATSEHVRKVHESSAQQWLQLAEAAERIEKAYPHRPLNRAAERNGASG